MKQIESYSKRKEAFLRSHTKALGQIIGTALIIGAVSFAVVDYYFSDMPYSILIGGSIIVLALIVLWVTQSSLSPKVQTYVISLLALIIPLLNFRYAMVGGQTIWALIFVFIIFSLFSLSRLPLISAGVTGLFTLAVLWWYLPEATLYLQVSDHIARISLIIISLLIAFWINTLSIGKERIMLAYTEEIENASLTDSTLHMPNRRAFERRLEEWKEEHHFQVWIINIDRFHVINEIAGYQIGDNVLYQIKQRINDVLPKEAYVARGHQDDFLIYLSETLHQKYESLEESLLQSIYEPIQYKNHQFRLKASMGMAPSDQVGTDAAYVMKSAEYALREAKHQGGGKAVVCTKELWEESQYRMLITNRMTPEALQKEFSLLFQPQCKTGSGRITGVEALIRWEEPENGFVSPETFIPIAEQNGFIHPLGDWVLREACKQTVEWAAAGQLKVAVNISPQQLTHAGFAESVLAILKETNFPPDSLELEITEHVLALHMEEARTQLQMLRLNGVRIAIDDFGTGYSSLYVLQSFPLDKIKIPREFIQNVHMNSRKQHIVQFIIRMAKDLKMDVLAEGIEVEEELHFLKEAGCRQAQGYYHYHPLDKNQLKQEVTE